MAQALSIVGYIFIILGIVMIIIAAVTDRRKGESEISQSIVKLPMFYIGAIVGIIGLIFKILFH